MKLLTGMTVASVLTLALCAYLLPAEIAGAGAQLEDEGLAVYGTVMMPGSRQPLADVRVDLVMSHVHRTTTTDASGRFRFTGLPAGTYELVPAIPGNPQVANYSRVRSGSLVEGALPADVALWAVPLSKLSGRVRGPDDAPIEGATVYPSIAGWGSLGYQLGGIMFTGSRATAITGPDGRFELTLEPGTYHLRVEAGDRESFFPFFYPGASRVGDAVPVTLLPGQDVGGIDIRQGDFRQARLRFRLPLVPESVADLSLSAASVGDGNVPLSGWVRQVVPNRPTGSDRLQPAPVYVRLKLEALGDDTYLTRPPLPPGEYDLQVEYEEDVASALRELGLKEWPGVLAARLRFAIDPEDAVRGELDLGTLETVSTVTVSGRVTLPDSMPTNLRPDPPNLMVQDRVMMYGFFGIAAAHPITEPDFTIELVTPSLYAWSAFPAMPDGMYFASITSGGRDVLREGLDVSGGPVPPVEIVIDDDGGAIEGVARDSEDQLVPDARIVLIPPPNRRGPFWRFPSVVADETGVFTLTNVPPGEYRILAVDPAGLRLDFGTYENPEFLRRYERRGERITVDPGAHMTINAEAFPIYE